LLANYFYQLYKINIMISHRGIALYWTVYGNHCVIGFYCTR